MYHKVLALAQEVQELYPMDPFPAPSTLDLLLPVHPIINKKCNSTKYKNINKKEKGKENYERERFLLCTLQRSHCPHFLHSLCATLPLVLVWLFVHTLIPIPMMCNICASVLSILSLLWGTCN